MTKYIPHPQERVSGPFHVFVNGQRTTLRTGRTFSDTTAILAALDEAGIVYTPVPLDASTGTASGRIRIPGTGSTQFVSIGGRPQSLAMNAWITPGAGVTDALDHAGIAYDIEYVDGTADQFTFTDVTGVTTGSTQTSNTITVAGLGDGVSVAVTVTGGTYSKNGGAYVSAAGTAVNSDTFAVRHTASGSAATAVNTVLTIGGVSDTYTSTTSASLTPGPELITNGSFTTTSNWTLTGAGTAAPTISGGKLNFVNFDDAGRAQAAQTLAGGSSPAGTYQYSADTTNTRAPGGNVAQFIVLVGAGGQNRGSANLSLLGHDGTLTGQIVANGEVTAVWYQDQGTDSTGDNFSLKLLS